VVDGAGVGDVLIERGVDYGLGKLADVCRRRPTSDPHAVAAGRLSARTILSTARTLAEAARTIPSTARAIAGAAQAIPGAVR
jgi:hypothetical protein